MGMKKELYEKDKIEKLDSRLHRNDIENWKDKMDSRFHGNDRMEELDSRFYGNNKIKWIPVFTGTTAYFCK